MDKESDIRKPKVPTDGGWGWVVVLGSFMIHVIIWGIMFSFGMFYIEFQKDLTKGKAHVAVLGILAPAITHFVGPLASAMSSRFGYRVVAVLGAILASIGFILSSFATNIYLLYVTFGILPGFGIGLMYLPAIVIVNLYFKEKRSTALGLAVCGTGVGTFIFPILIKFLIDKYNWRGATLIVAGIFLHCSVFGALFRPLYARAYKQKSNKKIKEIEIYAGKGHQENGILKPLLNGIHDQNVRKSFVENRHNEKKFSNIKYTSMPSILADNEFGQNTKLKPNNTFDKNIISDPSIYKTSSVHSESIRSRNINSNEKVSYFTRSINKTTTSENSVLDFSLLKDGVFLIFAFSNVCSYFGYVTPYIYLPHHAQINGMTSHNSALLVSVIGITATVGRALFGLLGDLRRVNCLAVYSISLILGGLAVAVIPTSSGIEFLFCCAAVFGLFSGSFVCLSSIVMVDLLGIEKLNSSFGFMMLADGLGLLIGPPIQGSLHDVYGNYNVSFYVAGIVMSFSGVMLFIIPFYKKWTKKNMPSIELVVPSPIPSTA